MLIAYCERGREREREIKGQLWWCKARNVVCLMNLNTNLSSPISNIQHLDAFVFGSCAGSARCCWLDSERAAHFRLLLCAC